MMKRLSIALSALIWLGVILPGLPALAHPARTPHENPEQAAGIFDGATLLLAYSQITDQANRSQYQNAREVLQDLNHIDPPDDIRYLIEQYNSLNENLYITLDTLESLLREATDRLSRNRAVEAGQLLNNSEEIIQDAEYLLTDTRTATSSLREKLGISATMDTDRLPQAYTRLEESINKLADLITRLKNTRQDLNEGYIRLSGLTPTTLNLNINRTSAFIGDSITVTGRLDSADGPLPAKEITIVADNLTVGSAVTGWNGEYTAAVSVPLLYRDNIFFTAQYEPSDEDAKILLSSQSLPVNIIADFYPTCCDISLPDMVFRGLPFTISGEVSPGENNAARQLKVSLEDLELASATVAGPFSLEVAVPPGATSGQRALKIDVAPAGCYAGYTKKQGINVAAPVLHIEARARTAAILPGTIDIEGKISNGPSPLADTPVQLRLMQATTTVRTAPNGSFTGTLKLHPLPADAPLSGNLFSVSPSPPDTAYDLSPVNLHAVTITAALPGYPDVTSTVQKRLLTINPLSMLAGLALATWLALTLVRKRHPKPTPEIVPSAPKAVKPPVEIPVAARPGAPVFRLTGIKGRVLTAYQSGLTAVEKITGVIMAPSATLREFLKTAHLPSPKAAAPFAELTSLAENSLYSVVDPPDTTAARAEELAEIINEELRRESP